VVHTAQFNGKQEGQADNSQPNLRCPRNGKWTNRQDLAPITATERSEQTLGKAMEVASTSPDTGQQGGCTLWRVIVTLRYCRGRR